MKFIRLNAHPELVHIIECYWIMIDPESVVNTQKIIPDGFIELIFHFADPYLTDITGQWCIQSTSLLAGQLKSYFHLQNTGTSGMVAIKFKPQALTKLFGFDMFGLTGKIVDLGVVNCPALMKLRNIILPYNGPAEVKSKLDLFFKERCTGLSPDPILPALDLIFSANGRLSIADMVKASGINERKLERLFKTHVGLGPKYYARIIRFNYIFKLIKSKNTNWSDIVFQAGYYDQSHFIRDFKTFTGVDPSSYYFDEKDMANFFLNK